MAHRDRFRPLVVEPTVLFCVAVAWVAENEGKMPPPSAFRDLRPIMEQEKLYFMRRLMMTSLVLLCASEY
jgi:hypothetical protein